MQIGIIIFRAENEGFFHMSNSSGSLIEGEFEQLQNFWFYEQSILKYLQYLH